MRPRMLFRMLRFITCLWLFLFILATAGLADNLLTLGVSGGSSGAISICTGSSVAVTATVSCVSTRAVPAHSTIAVVYGDGSALVLNQSVTDGLNTYSLLREVA